MVNLWKRSMSITPTPGRAAPNRSGRCVMAGADQQAAVAAAADRELRGEVYLFAISHSAAAMKSSNTFCLLQLHAGLVPVLAVFAAAAQVGHRVHAAHFHPDEVGRRRSRASCEMSKPP